MGNILDSGCFVVSLLAPVPRNLHMSSSVDGVL